MREILNVLNQQAGTTGSMVITPDGIMVAAALGPGFEEDAVAAFASSILLTFKRSLSSLCARGEMKTCTLNAAKSKVMFLDMKNSYLVLVADPSRPFD